MAELPNLASRRRHGLSDRFPSQFPSPDPPVYSALPSTPRQLSYPVVIPQRRPGSKERGFVEAYAPCLAEYGIDEPTFHDFIRSCNKAVEGVSALVAVQVVSFGVSMAPEPIIMGVATAVGVGAGVVNKQAIKYKTNSLIEKYNEQLFRPLGLNCLIMTYNNELDTKMGGAPERTSSSGRNDIFHKYHADAGRLPMTVAPLIFPDTGSDCGTQLRGGKFKKNYARFNNYLDQRARAQLLSVDGNGEDVLSTTIHGRSRPSFRNRYLDPNHPATNNGLIGLLSGGLITVDPEKKKRQRLARLDGEAEKYRQEHDRRLDDIYRNNYSDRQRRDEIARANEDFGRRMDPISKQRIEAENGKKKIAKDMLYILITNIPS